VWRQKKGESSIHFRQPCIHYTETYILTHTHTHACETRPSISHRPPAIYALLPSHPPCTHIDPCREPDTVRSSALCSSVPLSFSLSLINRLTNLTVSVRVTAVCVLSCCPVMANGTGSQGDDPTTHGDVPNFRGTRQPTRHVTSYSQQFPPLLSWFRPCRSTTVLSLNAHPDAVHDALASRTEPTRAPCTFSRTSIQREDCPHTTKCRSCPSLPSSRFIAASWLTHSLTHSTSQSLCLPVCLSVCLPASKRTQPLFTHTKLTEVGISVTYIDDRWAMS